MIESWVTQDIQISFPFLRSPGRIGHRQWLQYPIKAEAHLRQQTVNPSSPKRSQTKSPGPELLGCGDWHINAMCSHLAWLLCSVMPYRLEVSPEAAPCWSNCGWTWYSRSWCLDLTGKDECRSLSPGLVHCWLGSPGRDLHETPQMWRVNATPWQSFSQCILL